MIESGANEREVRAARYHSLFRAVNEKLMALNESFVSLTETVAIVCECADTTCIAMIDVDPAAYAAVRKEPRHFIVRRGHVYPDAEVVVRETQGYVVVEKTDMAGEGAETLEHSAV